MHADLRLLAIPMILGGWTCQEALAAHRDRWTRRLLRQAHRHVPFQRDRMDAAGVDPARVVGVEDLRRLPVVSRREYGEGGMERVVARWADPGRLLDRSTSGSTGERMRVKRTWFEERFLNAFRWRALGEYGYRPWQRVAVVDFRAGVDPKDGQSWQVWAQRLGLFRRRVFDGVKDPAAAAAELARFDPEFLGGMTSAMARVADAAMERGCRIRPRWITTGGELLTEPLSARLGQLGAPIRDLYGCNELNLIAWQCPKGASAYHVCDDAHVVEVLGADDRPVGAGEWGEVVVTGLFSYAMPLVRYRLGDSVMRGPDRCECGAPYSTLLAIRGRTIDTFELEGGALVHPWEILNAVRSDLGWVRQFQLVQVSRRHLELRVVVRENPAWEVEERMSAAARAAVMGKAEVTVVRVESLEAGGLVKARPFVPLR